VAPKAAEISKRLQGLHNKSKDLTNSPGQEGVKCSELGLAYLVIDSGHVYINVEDQGYVSFHQGRLMPVPLVQLLHLYPSIFVESALSRDETYRCNP
jgi:hypothetical protein